MLTVVARDVVTLQLVDSYQKEYLNEVERYKQKPSGDRDSARMGANEDSWFEAVRSQLFSILQPSVMACARA